MASGRVRSTVNPDEDDPPVEIQLLELIQQICDERVGREVGGHETEYHSL